MKIDRDGPFTSETWKLKSEGAYGKMIIENLDNNPLVVESNWLGFHRFYYNKNDEYYPITVVDFYVG